MNPSDDMLKIALAFVEQPDESQRVKMAFAAISCAPLSALIHKMLDDTPGTTLKGALTRIADLNQGRITDLDAPDFCSYIIRKTGITDQVLDSCKRALRSYHIAQSMVTSSTGLLMAARTDDGSARTAMPPEEILRELKRRK